MGMFSFIFSCVFIFPKLVLIFLKTHHIVTMMSRFWFVIWLTINYTDSISTLIWIRCTRFPRATTRTRIWPKWEREESELRCGLSTYHRRRCYYYHSPMHFLSPTHSSGQLSCFAKVSTRMPSRWPWSKSMSSNAWSRRTPTTWNLPYPQKVSV